MLALLSVGYYFSVLMGFNAYTLQVCERIGFLVGVNVVIAAANVGLMLLLAPRYGAVGVAAANLVALVAQNLINQWALRRSLGTAFIDRSCIGCYLAILACATSLWVFHALVDPGLLIGLAAAAVASFLVLLAGRRAIELGETFPEIQRVPLVRWLIR